jgi:hypothetical protein
MSKVLFDEHPIVLSKPLANALGLEGAVFVQQLHYRLQQKQSNPDKYRSSFAEGYFWEFNTVQQWLDKMPFLGSESKFKRLLARLREVGILVVGQFNKMAIDKTNWYRLDYDALEKLVNRPSGQNDPSRVSKWPDGSGQNEPTNNQRFPENPTENPTSSGDGSQAENFGRKMAAVSPPRPSNLSEQVRDALENMGINPIRAEQLIINFGTEAVQRQLNWLPYRGNLTSPGGYLLKAIQENYPRPTSMPEAAQQQDERLLKLRRIHSTRPEQRSYRDQLDYGGLIADLIEAQAAKAPQTVFTMPDDTTATWKAYNARLCTFFFTAPDGVLLALGAEELDQVSWAGKHGQVQEALGIYAAA